jgi:hypothetical protein
MYSVTLIISAAIPLVQPFILSFVAYYVGIVFKTSSPNGELAFLNSDLLIIL